MTVRIALVDDNGPELTALAEMLKTELSRMGQTDVEIAAFSSGEAFLDAWTPGKYDLILLDIFLTGIDGIEVARRIRTADAEVLLVFCTSSNEFAVESYEVEARYYLCKPIRPEDVTAMLWRLRLGGPERRRTVTLPGGRQVLLRSILYTEYYNHVVTLHLSVPLGDGDGDTLRVRTSQAEMEDLLLVHDGFLAPNRGVIVNLFAVAHMSREDMVLRNGHIIHIARRKYKEVREAYDRFRLRRFQGEVEL